MNGKFETIETIDPLGRVIIAEFGIIEEDNTAILDIASASGLELLKKPERNPLHTSTLGTGLIIKHLINKKYRKIIIGLGGSATTDGGIGIASALGYEFLDKLGDSVPLNGFGLGKLTKISYGNICPEIKNTEIFAASDVDNLLLGANGSAFIFGKQKGANQQKIAQLDNNLMNFARIVKRDLNIDITRLKSGGAAGGIGAGLFAFCHAKLVSGAELFFQIAKIEEKIKKADFIITGEGKIDDQTFMGKASGEILKIAEKYKIPVIAIAGKNEITNRENYRKFYKIFQLVSSEYTEREAINNAKKLLIHIGEKVGNLIIEKLK